MAIASASPSTTAMVVAASAKKDPAGAAVRVGYRSASQSPRSDRHSCSFTAHWLQMGAPRNVGRRLGYARIRWLQRCDLMLFLNNAIFRGAVTPPSPCACFGSPTSSMLVLDLASSSVGDHPKLALRCGSRYIHRTSIGVPLPVLSSPRGTERIRILRSQIHLTSLSCFACCVSR